MPGEPVQVNGARELRRTLLAAGRDLSELSDANRRAASIVADTARTTAPRRSGRLAGSVRPGATRRAGIIRAGNGNVPYANPIHWGWPRRNIAPHPFLSAAAESTEPAWLAVYADAIDDVLATIKGA